MVAVRLANELARMGQKVDLVVNMLTGPLVSQVDPRVSIVDLGARRMISALPRLCLYLRKRRPSAMVSVMLFNNINALVARRVTGWRGRLVVSQHNTFSTQAAESRKTGLFSWLFGKLVGGAHGVVAVSRAVAEDMSRAIGLPAVRVEVIYNPIITHDFDQLAAFDPGHSWFGGGDPVIVAVGRLVPQKDYPTLIRAIKTVRQARPVRLIVLGEGPLRSELQALASECGVADAIDFVGFKPQALPFIARADALVMTSAFEGFGNVLAEALGCGTPVVSTATNGPVEILDNGRYGPLTPVGDSEATAKAILETLDHPPDSAFLRAGAERFASDEIARRYLRAAFGA